MVFRLHRQRRKIQLLFFVVFMVLLTMTVWPLGRVFLGAFLVADPLLALNTAFNGVLEWHMLLAVGVAVLTVLLGRVFCGYVCPLGFLIEFFGPRNERHPRILGGRSLQVLRVLPLFVLAVSLGLMLFNTAIFLLFDPLSLLTRSVTTLLYPLLDRMARLAGDILYLVPPFRGSVDTVTAFLAGRIVFAEPLVFRLQVLTLVVIGSVFALSLLKRRFWCRYVCPLGALLGLLGRMSLFGRRIDPEKCINCLRCESVCSMDAVRERGFATDCSRCQLGLECADICPTGAIALGRRPSKIVHNPSRRELLTAGGLALLGGFFVYTGIPRAQLDAHLLRPPGARREVDFLTLCSRCGQCMKVCPTNVLQPAGARGGRGESLHSAHGVQAEPLRLQLQ